MARGQPSKAVACYRTSTGPLPDKSPADVRAQCSASLPTTNDFAPPFVGRSSELLTWWEKGDAFDDPPANAKLRILVGGTSYLVPLDPSQKVQVVRFTLTKFQIPPHGTELRIAFGTATWYARWQAPIRLVSCVAAPLGPKDAVATVGAAGRMAFRGSPALQCTELTDTAPPTQMLRSARTADAVHVHLERDGAVIDENEPEWKVLTAFEVFGPGGSTVAKGYEAKGGGMEAWLGDIGGLTHGTRLTARTKYDGQEHSYALRLDRPAMLYGKMGVWFPLALFGTTFEKSETGATLTALPVGVAWGGRYNVRDDFYLGASTMANYLIHKKVETSGAETSDYSLQSFSAGVLLDINNWAYFGGAYGWSFQTRIKDPGFMFVLGVGPGGFEFAKRLSLQGGQE